MFRRAWFVLALGLVACRAESPAPAAPAVPALAVQDGYLQGPASPDGTGRHFMGREIARVMGHEGASWLERPEREVEERPSLLVELLAPAPGATVADIGAGTGHHARLLARAVAPTGRVLAVDVQPEMLRLMERRMAREGLANVLPMLGGTTDPRLPAGELDLVLMVDVYHELSHPREMLAGIARALKPGGTLAIAEFRANDPKVPIKPLHTMSVAQLRREVESLGFVHLGTDDRLPWQHLVRFGLPTRPAGTDTAR